MKKSEYGTFKNFFFPSHLPRTSSAGLISSRYTSSSSFFLHFLLQHHFTSPPPLHHPPIFLSVYLSTFTVTALESQESKLAPSLSSPSQHIHALSLPPFHLSPSHWLRFISLRTSGVWKVPLIRPQGSQLCPVLVTHSHPAAPPSRTFTPEVGHLHSCRISISPEHIKKSNNRNSFERKTLSGWHQGPPKRVLFMISRGTFLSSAFRLFTALQCAQQNSHF